MTDTEQVRLLRRLEEEHVEHPHPGIGGGRLRLHLAVHAVVETQILEGKPTETARTLSRLMAQGLSRHQAIHAIGHVASEEVVTCLSQGKRYDEERYVGRLRALSAEDWSDQDPEDL
jgi:hypothetical protein